MDLIEHTYTIQWVGPMDYEEYREYLRNQELPNTLIHGLEWTSPSMRVANSMAPAT